MSVLRLVGGYARYVTVVSLQAVVKAIGYSQSNGGGQISDPRGLKTRERISMKLGTYNLTTSRRG